MNQKFAAILSGLLLLLVSDGAMAAAASYSPQIDTGLNIVKKAEKNDWKGAEAGVVIGIKGNVQRESVDGTTRNMVLGSGIQPGDTIMVDGNGYVQWMAPDGAAYAISNDAAARVSSYVYDDYRSGEDTCTIKVKKGTFQYVTGEMNKRSPGRTVFLTPDGKKLIPAGSAGYVTIRQSGKTAFFVTEGSLSVNGQSYAEGSLLVVDSDTGEVKSFSGAVDGDGKVIDDDARDALTSMGIDTETLNRTQAAYASAAATGKAVSQRVLWASATDREPPQPLVDIHYNPLDDEIGDTRPASRQ